MNRYIGALFLLAVLSSTVAGQTCPALSDAKKSALVEYVRKQYNLKEGTTLALLQDKTANEACYHALTFQGKSAARTWEMTMYLSPDGRYLTSELLDTTTDPVEEKRRKAESLMAGLTANKGSSQGPENAPVTIVEFSDFECPFCKRFTDLLHEMDQTERQEVRIVFHHMPLSMHPWARTAAEGAACAQLQNADAFWAMHDQIFQHQQDIGVDNIKQKLMEYGRNVKSLDMKLFQSCLDAEMSLGVVFQDMNLASATQVNGTPTVFINGRRIEGVRDSTQLRQLIEDAKAENKVAGSHSAGLYGGSRVNANR